MAVSALAPWWQINGFLRVRGTHRFWGRVRKTVDAGACWPWLGGRAGCGYGMLRWQGRLTYAHRLAFELAHGPLLPGQVVRHRCDNALCCRPSHLAAGWPRDNSADMVRRGRRRTGVLSAEQVRMIRERTDVPSRVLAAELGASSTAVLKVRRGECYAGIV